MWTRKELKEKGKAAMRRNYWKTVLVSVIMLILLGGFAGGSGARAGANFHSDSENGIEISMDTDDISEDMNEANEDLNKALQDAGISVNAPLTEQELQNVGHTLDQIFGEGRAVIFVGAFILGFLIVAALFIAIQAFLLNPLEVGGHRFFLRNLNRPAMIQELMFGYDHHYLNIVKTILLKDIYTILWTCLFIIPGIVKAYEYRMMPYILAEHPEMETKEVFARSREMMRGQKWKAFVLDLSFLGWDLLSLITVGLVGIFYVNPYRNMTKAALYETLAYGNAGQELPEPEVL
ncbi:MAG: DUF975 family protein [Lachnospiraceae bacterium]|nr:DUF975 family protein [Lachnospiraceae bacterium]